MSLQFYQGRRVLVTGHTGFKGSWLVAWLKRLGAEVSGVALPPDTTRSIFRDASVANDMNSVFCDIRDGASINRIFSETNPSIVIHLAAQPLVRRSYTNPVDTYTTNIIGTANILEACRAAESVEAAVIVTTDKVYDNKEWIWPYRENDPLGGLDPYSASKACAEIVAATYWNNILKTQRPAIATARGGNVIGGGDWSEDRLIPDIINSIMSKQQIVLRNPHAVRPWQHVLDLCFGYLTLAMQLAQKPEAMRGAWNFGPPPSSEVTVLQLVNEILGAWSTPDHPVSIAGSALHESQMLKLDTSKARQLLGWQPMLDFRQSVKMTATWYKQYLRDDDAAAGLIGDQIAEFESLIGPARS